LAKRTASAQKQARKSLKRRMSNRQSKLVLKTALKKLAAAQNKDEARKLLPELQSVIDKSAKKRLIHKKTAGRLKSRIARESADLK
jgi:small subunit ribosomal protein S20